MTTSESAAAEAQAGDGADDGRNDAAAPLVVRLPIYLLGAALVGLFVVHIGSGMADWGVSSDAMRHGAYDRLLLHMAAHASLVHVGLNVFALTMFAPAAVLRLGPGPLAWLRFAVLFVLGGVAGALVFLAIHPFGAVPMIGASGAIYALVGFLVRTAGEGGSLVGLGSPDVRAAAKAFVVDNLKLMLFFTLPALLTGLPGGLAWEAHLGGFVFGLLAAPLLRPRLNV